MYGEREIVTGSLICFPNPNIDRDYDERERSIVKNYAEKNNVTEYYGVSVFDNPAKSKEEFYKIDPKFLERGDFHLIRTNMNRKIKRINNKEMLDVERDNNFNKYGKRETNKERKNRLESNKNFRNYGIKETDLQRKKRESTLSEDT